MHELKTVCLALGPYRNLTTLTAGMLFLHPDVQVLNHGGGKIYEDDNLNFFREYSDEKFGQFVDVAISLSRAGKRGKDGGSILLSHAFDHDVIRERYAARYGEATVKDRMASLFWKESHITSNAIRSNRVDFDEIFRRNSQLRFLMPVRNPMDCARSNLQTKTETQYTKLFDLANAEPTVENVTVAVLKEFRWFLELEARYPSRFLHYFENAFSDVWPSKVAEFLQIAPDPQWNEDIIRVFQIKESYPRTETLMATYQDAVATHFSEFSEAKKQLLLFT